jgi:hypothetical protein
MSERHAAGRSRIKHMGYAAEDWAGKPGLSVIGNDAQFRKLRKAIGRPTLADDARYRSNADCVANRATLTEALEAALATQDGPAPADRLLRQGLPAGPVLPIDAALAAPHTAARQMVVEQDGSRGIGTPIKLSRTPGAVRSAPPPFGEHAGEVLAEHGYGVEEVEALEREGGAVRHPTGVNRADGHRTVSEAPISVTCLITRWNKTLNRRTDLRRARLSGRIIAVQCSLRRLEYLCPAGRPARERECDHRRDDVRVCRSHLGSAEAPDALRFQPIARIFLFQNRQDLVGIRLLVRLFQPLLLYV